MYYLISPRKSILQTKIETGIDRVFGGKILVDVVEITVLPAPTRFSAKAYISDVFPPAPIKAMHREPESIPNAETKSENVPTFYFHRSVYNRRTG